MTTSVTTLDGRTVLLLAKPRGGYGLSITTGVDDVVADLGLSDAAAVVAVEHLGDEAYELGVHLDSVALTALRDALDDLLGERRATIPAAFTA